jgi:type II secretory pathway component PulF
MNRKIKNGLLFKQLASYLDANFSLVDAVRFVGKKMKSKKVSIKIQSAIEDTIRKIEEGKKIIVACQSLCQVSHCDRVSYAILHASEKAGNLQKGFDDIAQHLLHKNESKRVFLSSLAYPLLVALFSMILAGALVSYIFPKILPLFESLHAPIPLPTKIALYTVQFITQHFFFLCFCFGFLVWVCRFFYTQKNYFKYFIHAQILKVPYIKDIVFATESSLCAQNLSILVRSGVALPDAILIVITSISFLPIRHDFNKILEVVLSGKNMSHGLLESSTTKESDWCYVVEVGEKTGKLDQAFSDISTLYQKEVQEFVSLFTKASEPILMVFVAGVVLLIALSVMQPMYSIIQYVSPQ